MVHVYDDSGQRMHLTEALKLIPVSSVSFSPTMYVPSKFFDS